jgi:hypothetical protein
MDGFMRRISLNNSMRSLLSGNFIVPRSGLLTQTRDSELPYLRFVYLFRWPCTGLGGHYGVSIENASPLSVHWLKPFSAPLRLTMVNSIVSSGFADDALGWPNSV